MKKYKLLSLTIVLLLVAGILSGCAGGAGIASSWPGLLVDTPTSTAYLATTSFVYSINLANGSEKWRFPVKADNRLSFFAQPALTEDGQLIEGSYHNILYSINLQNGQQNWTFPGATDKYIGGALTTSDGIYAPNANNKLYALTSAGNQRWVFEAGHSIWSKPLTDGTAIFVASMDHHVYALDPTDGNQVWKSEDLGGAIVHSFVYDPQGVLYVGTIGNKLSALNASDGKTLWQTPLKSWIWSKAVLGSSSLFICDQEGFIYALDPKTGAIQWQVQPDVTNTRAIVSTPLLVDTTLYVANQGGNLISINAANGAVNWSKTIGGNISTDLELSGDTILIAPLNFDSTLVAVDLQGNNRWSFVPVK
jgi:outer membrane protein assembly factor BamB